LAEDELLLGGVEHADQFIAENSLDVPLPHVHEDFLDLKDHLGVGVGVLGSFEELHLGDVLKVALAFSADQPGLKVVHFFTFCVLVGLGHQDEVPHLFDH